MADGMAPQSGGGNRLFVGNLSWGTTDESLHEAFTLGEGAPIEAKVIIDRQTGRSRGFGFVTYPTADLAAIAKERMHEVEVDKRPVRVDYATGRN